MSTDWEVTKEDCRLAAPPSPLPTINESEDIPPLTQTADGLNAEPNQAPPDHPDIDEWGIYRGDEQEPNKVTDDIYYSDNDVSPVVSTFEHDHQLMQRPSIEIDHNNRFDTPTLTIIHLQQEVTKLSLTVREQMRINQQKSCQIATLSSKLQFEEMLSTHLKARLNHSQSHCHDLARDKQHALVYHEHIDEFNKCNESILKYAGYLSTDNFYE